MPVIRIDPEVYAALQRHGRAFEDTPNDVLRRLLQLSLLPSPSHEAPQERPRETETRSPTAAPGSRGAPKHYRRRPRTQESAFYGPILKALSALGGRGVVRDVLRHIEPNVRTALTAADREPLSNGEVRWENTAKWARKRMIGEGLLRRNSPHGIWELTEEGQRQASQRLST